MKLRGKFKVRNNSTLQKTPASQLSRKKDDASGGGGGTKKRASKK